MTEPNSGARLNRRSLFGAAAATIGTAAVIGAAGSVTPAHAVASATGGLPKELEKAFRKPGTASAAGFRWWWPHGLVDPAEIAREVDQVADAGFGILEVAVVTHSLRARGIEIDVDKYGWGSPAWVAGVKAALARAAERAIRIDITVGPSWPAAVPTITPEDEAASSELAYGRADVAAGQTFDAELPAPTGEAHSSDVALVTVQAHRVTATTSSITTVDPESYVDLSGSVTGNRLAWTAPADPAGSTWAVLATWRRGSGQEPEAGPHTDPRSYVVDHFSEAGTQAVIDLWEDRVLDGELRARLRAAGGYLFEDSLEIETEATIWTPRMLEEFEARAGYDLRPWLPVVLEVEEDYQFALGTPGAPATTDALRTNQVRDDFNQVLSDLYRDYHLRPMQSFAHSLGLGLRIQAYGLETDTTEHAAILDIAETESLGFKNLDDFRVMAGGRDIAGKKILSCEAICYNGAAYNTTWGFNSVSPTAQNQALFTLNSIFAAGVNQAMIHGFPYAAAPDVTWPGFAAFSPYYNGAVGFGEAWGPRTPQWEHIPGIASYLARTQGVLQTGTPKYDIVFLRQKSGASTGIGPFWVTNDGTKLGWSHSFITSALLTRDDVTFGNGRLAPDGPAYKVLVIGPDKIRSREVTIDLAAARKVLELGRAGLPVILVNDAGKDWARDATPIGRTDAAAVTEVRELMAKIAALPTTRSVLEAGVGGALAELGVVRDVEHPDSTVMHVRRVVGDVDLYYVANARHAENRRLNRVTQDVWLTATDRAAVPWLLDAWSGEVTRVAAFERSGDRVRVRVDLVPGQSTVIALAPAVDGHRAGAPAGRDGRPGDRRPRRERRAPHHDRRHDPADPGRREHGDGDGRPGPRARRTRRLVAGAGGLEARRPYGPQGPPHDQGAALGRADDAPVVVEGRRLRGRVGRRPLSHDRRPRPRLDRGRRRLPRARRGQRHLPGAGQRRAAAALRPVGRDRRPRPSAASRQQRHRGRGRLDPAQPVAGGHPGGVRRRDPSELRARRAGPAGAVRREGGACLTAAAG